MLKIVLCILFNISMQLGFCQTDKLPFKLKEDTASARIIYNVAKDSLKNGNIFIAREYALMGLALSDRIHYENGKALHYQMLANSFNVEANNDSALFYYKKALDICISINNKKGIGKQYSNVGTIYYFQGNFVESLSYFLKSLKIQESIRDSVGIASANNYIGSIYWYQKAYNDALKHYKVAAQIFKNNGDLNGYGLVLNNIGMILEIQNDKTAIDYYKQAIDIHKKTKNNEALSMALNNLGAFYQVQLKDLKAAESCYRESMLINEKENNIDGLGLNYTNIGVIKADLKDYKGADEWLKKGIDLYKKNKMPQGLIVIYEKIAQIYYDAGRYKEAFQYHTKYTKLNDSINLGDKLAEMEAKYGKEKHENEIELLKKDKVVNELEIKRKQVIIYSSLIGSVLLLLFIVFIVRGYNAKKKANVLLEENNIQITHQKDIIEEKSKEITDSINYAKRIQYSLLASDKLLEENLSSLGGTVRQLADGGGYFIFFKPKDVVSGDFYWGASAGSATNKKFILVTADSTGHGVPGAIMSMLNISCLNESVNADKLIQPAEILNATRKKIISHLSNDGSAEGGKDGMDCSLISFDFIGKKLTYSAANNPVWIVRSNFPLEGNASRTGDVEFISLMSDRMPIGKHDKDNVGFTQHDVDLKEGDMVYTFTDGFPDQFGGPKGKKFKYKQLEELLISISQESLDAQREKLNEVFENWKGGLEQVDDVTIIGIRI